LSAQSNLAAAGHCIYGVVDHVHEHFAQLDRVTHHKQLRIGEKGDADLGTILACFPAWPAHFADILHQVGDGNSLKFAAGREGGEVLDAPDDLGPVFRALDDHLDAGAKFVGVFGTHQKLSASEYPGKRIVDVVGDAEREFTEGGHLFG